jgi:hypothetical protein
MGFLESFTSTLFDQVGGMSQGTPKSLDVGGSFGALGKFASQIDKTAHRQYIETGTIRNIRPRAAEVLMQEPDMTVVVKKRMFSSLVENFRMDLMDSQEKLFVRATKRLFHNKCRVISAYERLTKIERIASKGNVVSDGVLSSVFSMVDILNASPATNTLIDAKTQSTLDTIRRARMLSDPNFRTTWVTDRDLPYVSDLGDGTGVMELTMVRSMNCTTSTDFNKGNASLDIEDPYKLMIITEGEIETALAEASNRYAQSNFFKLSDFQLGKATTDLKLQLNAIRRARGASDIIFRVNEESLLYKKIIAIIDEEGREIKFEFDTGALGVNLFSFSGSSVVVAEESKEGTNGLQEGNELDFFKQIVQNMFVMMGLKNTTQSEIISYNETHNYVRQKLMLHYGNKPIIQPMDVVYIYIGSKTIKDPKLNKGLRTDYLDGSLLNKLNEAVGNVESMVDDIKNGFGGGTGASFVENEKNAIAGPEFPMWLWTLLKNDLTRQAAGTCVFVGPVDEATHEYSVDNGYRLNVSIKDNTHYFEMGQINIKPSLHVYNGNLYDPLTPLKPGFDSYTGAVRGSSPPLLDENIALLNSGSIRSKLGRNRGKSVTKKIYNRADIEPMVGDLFGGLYGQNFNQSQGYRKKYHDPDGFVYRWKEGIGSLTVYGEPHSTLAVGSFRDETAPNITANPFAGQDVMNVLSLLVTGQPYNFNSFLTSSIRNGTFNNNNLFGGNDISYMTGLISSVNKQNATWGNFVPFKKLIINEAGYNYAVQGANEISLIRSNAQLAKLLRERAEFVDQFWKGERSEIGKNVPVGISGEIESVASATSNKTSSVLYGEITKLDSKINVAKSKFIQQMQQPNLQSAEGTLSIFGNDISFDPTITLGTNPVRESARVRERSEFRKKLNFLTQRRLWKVKANNDSNLFIVDDNYDKNYDIQAFERAITDLKLFDSQFSTVKEQISTIKEMLGLEVYADSQGHIQARPPQYNRMPKSVFHSMLQRKAQKGIQIFPEYLEGLFFNKLDGLIDRLEIVEDNIRLRASYIGGSDDASAQRLLSEGKNGFVGLALAKFDFISNEQTGKIGGGTFREMFEEDKPDLLEERFKKPLEEFATELSGRLGTVANFSVATRADLLTKETFNTNDPTVRTRAESIAKRLRGSKNIQDVSSIIPVINNVSDLLRNTEELADLVSERQSLIKLIVNTLKNLRQGLAVNEKNSQAAHQILMPNLASNDSNVEFPELLEHMIEDGSVDDLGDGSGRRYVIEDSQVLSLSIKESAPAHTVVQVDGSLNTGLVKFPPDASLGGGAGFGGNAIGTAYAADYDMWRMYGFKSPKTVPAPFFSNPTTQCAPYAVYLLNLARKRIFSGTTSIVGNEFIQPGEVYYIEDRDLLFYSESVSHSFTYNGSYSTSINLQYGRNPGEYIPTQLDVIGKGLYTNRFQANLIRSVRHGRADNNNQIATIIYENSTGSFLNDSAVDSLVSGKYAENNRKNLANILLTLKGFLTESSLRDQLKIEIRIFSKASQKYPESYTLKQVAESIKGWIINPRQTNIGGNRPLVESSVGNEYETGIDTSKLIKEVRTIDLDETQEDETESPSQQAWYGARLVTNSFANLATDDSDQQSNNISMALNKALVYNIIDIWAVYDEPTLTLEERNEKTQQAQEENALSQAEVSKMAEAKSTA